ncbi:MAG: membrane protein insertase YidC [Muribaculaceae bacterium]|nr:membrane protein insertase YidC [Muribaculaceae bacterium]
MDKNNLLGLLLMGAIIFGFMYINQPSDEEIAAAQKAQIEATQNNDSQNEEIAIDSLTPNQVSKLVAMVKASGEAQNDGTYTLATGNVDLRCDSTTLSGTVTVNNNTVDVKKIVANDLAELPRPVAKAAVDALISSIDRYDSFGNFAQYMGGNSDTLTLENDVLKVDFSSEGGKIAKVTLKKYDTYVTGDTTNVVPYNGATDYYSFTLPAGAGYIETRDLSFKAVAQNDSTVLMKLDLDGGAMWGIRYTLGKGESYVVKMDIVQENIENVFASNMSDITMSWHQKMARNEKGKTFEERNSTIYYKYLNDSPDYLTENGDQSEELEQEVKWISFKNQFFSSVMVPKTSIKRALVTTQDIKDQPGYLKVLDVKDAIISYSTKSENPASFDMLFTPNLYPLLSSYDEQLNAEDDLELTRLIPLGWGIFRWVNTYLVIPIFTFLGGFISNYGIIILLLTIIVKIILFPFTYKSYMSQAKMRVLAPEIQAINEKYPKPEDAMTKQQKTMELYSKAGASPFSGCLPMLLQMPILIALFAFFPSCIELRGQSFLWATDLSAPDAIFSWTTHIPLISTYFGNHVSLFCLLMTATNIIYTHINMQNQPGGAAMPGMKWMMYLMPVMFLFFFNDYASGLSYYYFLSLLITIVQTYSFRFIVDEEKVRAQMLANAKKPRKKSGFMARLEEAQRQQQAMLREQQKQQAKKRR